MLAVAGKRPLWHRAFGCRVFDWTIRKLCATCLSLSTFSVLSKRVTVSLAVSYIWTAESLGPGGIEHANISSL